MAWCITPIPWNSTDTWAYSIAQGPYAGNVNSGQFSNGNPAAIVSLFNDIDRLTPYFWTFRDGCLCVENPENPTALPEAIKWDQNGETSLTPFAEVEKSDKTPEQIEDAKQCFEDVFGCALEDLVPDLEEDCPELFITDIYRLAPNDAPGVLNREWHDTAPVVTPISASDTAVGRDFRLGHDFSLTPDTATTIAVPNPNDTNNTATELDIQVQDTFINVPAGGVWLQLTGGSEGYWAIELGECCGPLQLRAEFGGIIVTTVGPVFIPEGQHALRIWNIDSGGTNSSKTDQWSLDGLAFSNAIPAGVEFSTTKREWLCEKNGVKDPVPEGWSTKAPLPCVTDPFSAADATPPAEEFVPEPFPDCELPEYDDARPVLVGPATELQNSNFRRTSTDRIIEMSYRVRFLADSTTSGWVYLQAVTPPGLQLMQLQCRGAYYQTGSQDINTAGVTPYEEQYMGGNGVEWIAGRLYFLHFSASRKFEDVNVVAHITAKYKKVV